MKRVPSIPFCQLRLSITVPFERCALHGVWSALCACTRTETNSRFARVYFFAERTPAWRCSAPVSLGQLLCCAKRISCALVAERRHSRLEFSFRLSDVNQLRVQSKDRHVGVRHFSVRPRSRPVTEETCANPSSQQLRKSVYFVASAISDFGPSDILRAAADCLVHRRACQLSVASL